MRIERGRPIWREHLRKGLDRTQVDNWSGFARLPIIHLHDRKRAVTSVTPLPVSPVHAVLLKEGEHVAQVVEAPAHSPLHSPLIQVEGDATRLPEAKSFDELLFEDATVDTHQLVTA